MSRPYRYPDFFDPIFDAVEKPPDIEGAFLRWCETQRPERYPIFIQGTTGAGFRFTARGAPHITVNDANPRVAEGIFRKRAREYWEENVRK